MVQLRSQESETKKKKKYGSIFQKSQSNFTHVFSKIMLMIICPVEGISYRIVNFSAFL
jgi:hypothetical protein